MFLSFSEGMLRLDQDAFSLRWYKDMIYGTKNPWGLAAKNSFIIAIFAATVPKRTEPIVAKIAIIKLFLAAKPQGFLVP